MTAQTPRERLDIRLRAHCGVLADAGLADLREHEAAVEAAARAAGHADGLREAADTLDADAERAGTLLSPEASQALTGAAYLLRCKAAAGQAPAQEDPACPVCLHELHTGVCGFLDGSCNCAGQAPAPQPDTLPQWLHQRYAVGHILPFSALGDADRTYWEHEAAAVRRAVARGGFKAPAPQPETAPDIVPACTCTPPHAGTVIHDGACELSRAATRARQLRYATEGWYVPDTEHLRPAPDAESGTPDDREQLREQYAAVLLDSAGRLQPRHVADPDALIRELLAVRDDALADALAPRDSQDGGNR